MPSYLVHFNRLHDKKGRFTYGDGDGDGQRSDISKSARKNPGKSRDQNTGHRRYEKNNTYKRINLDDGKVSRDWNDATRRGYGRALETGNSLARNHSKVAGSRPGMSKFGPVTPKTPGFGDGSGRSRGDWSGNSSGSNYTGTSHGGSASVAVTTQKNLSDEAADEMTEMLEKIDTREQARKKYQQAVEKGKDFVDKVFGGKEASTNAKSSDKYRKSDNAGKHGYDKRK